MGIRRATFDRITEDGMLFQKLLDLVLEEGSPLYTDPEEYASYADHILLSIVDLETNEPLSDEEIAQKYATAEDLLSQLQNAGDSGRETLFDQLVEEYGEDPGRAAGKGYMVTAESNFVPEFLDAALNIEPGQVSEIVESTYGYHILYRRHMDSAEKEMLSSPAEEHLYDLLAEMADAFEVKASDEASALNLAEFYTNYNAKVEEIAAAKAAENSGGTTDGEDADSSGEAGDGTDTGSDAEDGNATPADSE